MWNQEEVQRSCVTNARLGEYARLLEQYHGTLDLVSTKGIDELDRLIEEARAYAAVISDLVGQSAVVVDLGSGAGLPGVVIAAELPGATVHLVERRRRRGAFLDMAAGRLDLDNAIVHTADITALSGVCADVVTAQAVSTFASVARLTRHLHRDPCYLVSRRGPSWHEELNDLSEWLSPGSHRHGTFDDDVESPAMWAFASASTQGEAVLAVADERPLGRDGSLVALRLAGGRACPPSG